MADPARILLIGPGAVGGTVAAWLQHAGHDVTLAVRTPFERLHVETPTMTLRSRPRLVRVPDDIPQTDWVLVVTKTYDVEGAAQWLRAAAEGQSRVAILQNGVEHLSRFSPFVPPERLLPVMVDIPAEPGSGISVSGMFRPMRSCPSGCIRTASPAMSSAETTTM